MATSTIGIRNREPGTTHWGAIFGGTFVYIAVMSTFGLMLASAIFASAGWSSLGFVIWNAVVAIISLYIAGRATGHLAAVTDKNIGMWHGLITFGMSFLASVIVLGIVFLTAAPYSSAPGAATGSSNAVLGRDLISVASTGGWALWCAMIFGFIAAAMGGSQGARENVIERPAEVEQPNLRRVA